MTVNPPAVKRLMKMKGMTMKKKTNANSRLARRAIEVASPWGGEGWAMSGKCSIAREFH